MDRVLRWLLRLVLVGVMIFSLQSLYQTRVIDREKQIKKVHEFEENFNYDNRKTSRDNEVDIARSLLEIQGILYIPSIDVRLPIYTGTSEEAITDGIGVIEGSGRVDDIKSLNPVLTSHNGVKNSLLLTNLDKVKEGDEVYVKLKNNKINKYIIFESKVVSPVGEQKEFHIPEGKDRYLTLRTCTPTFVNSHRLLVTGKKVPFSGIIPESNISISSYEYYMGGFALLALLLFIFSFTKKKVTKKKEVKNVQENII